MTKILSVQTAVLIKKVGPIIICTFILINHSRIEADEDDDEWKPVKDPRYLAETDDESSNESDKELAKKEAEEFIRGSTADHNGRIIKKPRVDNE